MIPQITMIPTDELTELKNNIKEILKQIEFGNPTNQTQSQYVTAVEFMDAVRIRRSKFDDLVSMNTIKTITKGRKIYVVASEISRYFSDASIK